MFPSGTCLVVFRGSVSQNTIFFTIVGGAATFSFFISDEACQEVQDKIRSDDFGDSG